MISYESHSAIAMADAMRLFLNMPEEKRIEMAESALAAASVVYDEALLTQRLERLYDSLYVETPH